MFRKYHIECECLGVKGMGKTSFIKFYKEQVFEKMTQVTCACSQCVEEGDAAFDSLCNLVKDVFPSGSELRLWFLDDLANLQHFYQRQYRSFLEKSSVEAHQCLTRALSRPGQEEFSCPCDHPHVSTVDVLERDTNLLNCLRGHISIMKSGTERDDFLWALDGAEIHLHK
jgi:uncharacterized protein YeaO (DUF488 family)